MEVVQITSNGRRVGVNYYHVSVKNWKATRENIAKVIDTTDKHNWGGVVRPMYTNKDGLTVLSVEIYID